MGEKEERATSVHISNEGTALVAMIEAEIVEIEVEVAV